VFVVGGKHIDLPIGSTPLSVFEAAGLDVDESVLAARLDGQVLSLFDPIPSEGVLAPLTFKDEGGREAFWHSGAHLLAYAARELFPTAKLAIGPAIVDGFYYDFDVPEPFTPEDLSRVEEKMRELASKDLQFSRRVLPRDQALSQYEAAGEKYKAEIISELPPDAEVTEYVVGEFSDLCRGPHVRSLGVIRAVKVLSSSGAYWRGDERNPMLQRIYGVAFPTSEQLDAFVSRIEEAKRRDHRRIGREMGLFSFHPEGAGFAFFKPAGVVLMEKLLEYWREVHEAHGYREIRTPMILSGDLWRTSGHMDNYREQMYFTDVDGREHAVKPMNCPGGVLVYREDLHSYRELPMRIAELGVCHRHERSGVLHGLFRVRAFIVDDAHIYCTPDQVEDEVVGVVNLITEVYSTFGFREVELELSTRPEKSIGTDEMWRRAESALEGALVRLGREYKVNPGDGAFYGPKIDFHVTDAMGRRWQLGTCQLDFALPERFDLTYIGPDGRKHRVVMIHRACLGSIERFIGVLIEQYAGDFPLWLAPEQVRVVPISDDHVDYARYVGRELTDAGLRATVDDRSETMRKRIRESELARVPVVFVVGGREAESNAVSMRRRGAGDMGARPLSEAVSELVDEVGTRRVFSADK
jgi:threonyl-tRNA synthetase